MRRSDQADDEFSGRCAADYDPITVSIVNWGALNAFGVRKGFGDILLADPSQSNGVELNRVVLFHRYYSFPILYKQDNNGSHCYAMTQHTNNLTQISPRSPSLLP